MLDDLKFATLDQWPMTSQGARERRRERPAAVPHDRQVFAVPHAGRERHAAGQARHQRPAAGRSGGHCDGEDPEGPHPQHRGPVERRHRLFHAGGSAVDIGLGFFRITTEYVSDDSFDQEIFIRPVPNTFSVYLGEHVMPDGSDAETWLHRQRRCRSTKFKAEFRKRSRGQGLRRRRFRVPRVLENRARRSRSSRSTASRRPSTRCSYLADGTTISAEDYAAWPKEAGAKPSVRTGARCIKRELKWRKMTAVEILDQRDLPGKYIPIVEVIGREIVHWRQARPVGPRAPGEGLAADVQLLVEHHHREDGARA
jgi:hypothetical protein